MFLGKRISNRWAGNLRGQSYDDVTFKVPGSARLESVAWTYDGVQTITATITNAEVGITYDLFGDNGASFAQDIAVSSTLVLTITDFLPADSQPNGDMVVMRDDDGQYVAATIFTVGDTAEFVSDIAWDFNGTDQIEAEFITVAAQDYTIGATGVGATGYTGAGALEAFTHFSASMAGDYFVARVYENDGGIYNPIGNRLFTLGVPGAGVAGNPGDVATETTDAATVYIDIQVSGVDDLPGVDAATILVDIQASAVEAAQLVDAATVYIDITNTGGECYTTSSGQNFDAEAWVRWRVADAQPRWVSTEEPRWFIASVSSVEGC